MSDSKSGRSRIAEKILRLFTSENESEAFVGDLDEYCSEPDRNPFLNGVWFWYQIIKSLIVLLIQSTIWSIFMFKNYLKIAFRTIKRNKSYSALNIIGFAVGIAAYLLIGLYINYELNYDKHHENADRVYQVFTGFAVTTPAPLAPTLMREFSEVESATRVEDVGGFLLRYEDKAFIEEDWVWADPNIFDVFTFPLVMGDSKTVLDKPYSVVITEEMVAKYFGNKNPINKVLSCTFLNGSAKDFTVTGVLKDIPENSYIKGDFFAVFETLSDLGQNLDTWGNWDYDTFFLLQENTDITAFEEKYIYLLETKYDMQKSVGFYSKKLSDLHLRSSGLRHMFGPVNDIKYIYLFSIISIGILLMACINYLNLSTARSIQRGKEVGVRKVAGANQFQIISQFLGESLVLITLSLIFAIALTYLLLPIFNELVDSEGTIGLFSNISSFIILIISVIFVGLLSGSYPALFMSRFNPLATLKGSSLTSSRGVKIRNMLVVIQFSISIILLISTMVTSKQINYLRSKNLGYTKDKIVVVPIKDSELNDQKMIVKEDLMQQTGITKVSFSSTLPLKIDWLNNYSFDAAEGQESDRITTYYAYVDYDYFDLFEMKFVMGRKFDEELDAGGNVYIINEAVCRKLGWDNPIGKKYGKPAQWGTIVGVVSDFHNISMRSSIPPVTISLNPNAGRTMSIRVNTDDIQETLTAIEGVWKEYSSGYPFEFEFMDKQYDALYKSEIRRGQSFNYFSLIAIFICCLGLFGLASFTIEQSTKVIGIRKVLGASAFTLIKMLLWKFLKWTVIANLVAYPIAYFLMKSWLQEYAYRIDLGWGIFLSAGLIAVLIAFLTVIVLTIKASRANPVDAISYE